MKMYRIIAVMRVGVNISDIHITLQSYANKTF